MAKKTTDDLTFKKAFAFFRKKHGGDGGKFRWQGKVYTTDTAKAKKTPASTGPTKRPAIKTAARTKKAMSYGPQKQSPSKRTSPKKPSTPKSPGKAPKVMTDMRETSLRSGSQGRANALSAKERSRKIAKSNRR